jgi:2-polyprenyl-6-methoxyphenol hydroxylase-like FAD-dependent oxidoreductase
MDRKAQGFGHAVVIGGSMGGLLTARVLADHFARVTILERDELPDRAEPRKGTPQARHVHLMLEAGTKIVDQLFPGMLQDMVREGAVLIDVGRDMAWKHFGAWKTRYESGFEGVLCTRMFLEWHVRRRVRELPNVEIRERCAVESLVADAARTRVTGVLLRGPGGEETLPADLVVDASGRGTRAPRWLEDLGYGKPDEEIVGIDLAYTSRQYQPPAGFDGDWKVLIQYPRSPETWRAGFITMIEGDRWLVSLNGYFGDHPPTDDAGFLEFARSVSSVYDQLRHATPLTEAVTHKIPANRWLHYERLPRWPEGFVVMADAVCSFNPIFAQGMTVASLSARLLGQCLTGAARDLHGVAPRFQRKLSGIIRLPWFLATTADLHYPQTTGKRPVGLGAVHWFVVRLIELTSLDIAAAHRFNALLHMRTGASGLLDPRLTLSVLAYGVKALFVPLEQRANVDTFPPAPGRGAVPARVNPDLAGSGAGAGRGKKA